LASSCQSKQNLPIDTFTYGDTLKLKVSLENGKYSRELANRENLIYKEIFLYDTTFTYKPKIE